MKSKPFKKITCIILTILLTVVMLNTGTAQAAAGIVYEYSKMIESDGNIYYIPSVEGSSYNIYRLNPKTGAKTKIASSDTYITALVTYNNTLYYTSDNANGTGSTTYSVSLDGGSPHTLSKGVVCYADKSGIYYTIENEKNCLLYRKSYAGSKDVLLYKGNSSFKYIKNIGSTLYFGQSKGSPSRIELLSLKSGKAKPALLSSLKLKAEPETDNPPAISDLVSIKGNLYYQYGTYQGSGSFWYGTLVKFDTAAKKSTIITDQMIVPSISYSGSSIYFDEMQSTYKHHSYNVTSGKLTAFTCPVSGTEYYNVMGSYAYKASVNKKSITVSRFTAGTNNKNLKKDFIKIPYPQNSKLSYTASITSLGQYFLVPVECVDYNDSTYGWRGKIISIKWYVTDYNGNILTHFE
ncbi:hypothetical protein [Anaerocolumna jejuensis]|uniref:hypothetical protein n=1 Tax=Anaerocolumna jejuensis TaxID=259063 RepID=UPI003F7BE238